MHALVLIAVLALGASSDAILVKQTGDLRIYYHAGDESKLDSMMDGIEQTRQDLRDKLGIDFKDQVEVVLARGRKEFEEWAGEDVPGWALAIAHTRRRGIVVNMELTTPTLENNLLFTMRHELCHLALGQVELETGHAFPRWFHEGVAVRVTGFRHFQQTAPFEVLAAHNRLIPLSKLANDFPAAAAGAELAYMESERFVNFLAEQTDDSLLPLIAEFKKGAPFTEAVQRATGKPLPELEREWRDSIKSSHPWLFTFWRILSLFAILAIGTIIAFVIVSLRGRRKKHEWANEEAIVDAAYEDKESGDTEDASASLRADEEEDENDYYDEDEEERW